MELSACRARKARTLYQEQDMHKMHPQQREVARVCNRIEEMLPSIRQAVDELGEVGPALV